MFYGASSFSQCLSTWAEKTSNYVDTTSMLNGTSCTSIYVNPTFGPWCQDELNECIVPSSAPTAAPTVPTMAPSMTPSITPSMTPTSSPTHVPTDKPTKKSKFTKKSRKKKSVKSKFARSKKSGRYS